MSSGVPCVFSIIRRTQIESSAPRSVARMGKEIDLEHGNERREKGPYVRLLFIVWTNPEPTRAC